MYQHEDFDNYQPAHPMLKADNVIQHSPQYHYHGPVETGAQHIHYHFHNFEDSAGLFGALVGSDGKKADKLYKEGKIKEMSKLYKLADGTFDYGDSSKGGLSQKEWVKNVTADKSASKKRPDLPTMKERAAATARAAKKGIKKVGAGALAAGAAVGGAVVGGVGKIGKSIAKVPSAFIGEEPEEEDEQF